MAPTLPLADLVDAYRERRGRSNEAIRSAASLEVTCPGHPGLPSRPGLDLRYVLLHLLEETAQHLGHAESARELLDGRVSAF